MEEVDHLMELLKSKDNEARRNASEEIVKIGSAAVPALIEMLRDKNSGYRYDGIIIEIIGNIDAEYNSTSLPDKPTNIDFED